MDNFEQNLAKEFMTESVPIEESELISINNHGDFITFTTASQFQLLNIEKSFFEKVLSDEYKNYFKNHLSIKFNITYQLIYDVSFTDLNTEEFYFEPIDIIKNIKCKIFNITTNDDSDDTIKLKEYLFTSEDFSNQLINKTLDEELIITQFRPFALEQYM